MKRRPDSVPDVALIIPILVNWGSDCVHPFVALQSCIKANPDAFANSVTEDEKETKKEEQPPVQDHRIIPPLWAKDLPRSNKSKL